MGKRGHVFCLVTLADGVRVTANVGYQATDEPSGFIAIDDKNPVWCASVKGKMASADISPENQTAVLTGSGAFYPFGNLQGDASFNVPCDIEVRIVGRTVSYKVSDPVSGVAFFEGGGAGIGFNRVTVAYPTTTPIVAQ